MGISHAFRTSARRIASFLLSRLPQPDLGRKGEAAAARHLRRCGLRILARNFRTRSGEIDLVALDKGTLVFVEVKSALSSTRGDPIERIHPTKIRRIRRTALYCRRWMGEEYSSCRIDGVVVDFVRGLGGRAALSGVRWYPALYSFEDE